MTGYEWVRLSKGTGGGQEGWVGWPSVWGGSEGEGKEGRLKRSVDHPSEKGREVGEEGGRGKGGGVGTGNGGGEGEGVCVGGSFSFIGIPPDVRGGLRARLCPNSTVRVTVAPTVTQGKERRRDGEGNLGDVCEGEGEEGEGWRVWLPPKGEEAVYEVSVRDILTVGLAPLEPLDPKPCALIIKPLRSESETLISGAQHHGREQAQNCKQARIRQTVHRLQPRHFLHRECDGIWHFRGGPESG